MVVAAAEAAEIAAVAAAAAELSEIVELAEAVKPAEMVWVVYLALPAEELFGKLTVELLRVLGVDHSKDDHISAML